MVGVVINPNAPRLRFSLRRASLFSNTVSTEEYPSAEERGKEFSGSVPRGKLFLRQNGDTASSTSNSIALEFEHISDVADQEYGSKPGAWRNQHGRAYRPK